MARNSIDLPTEDLILTLDNTSKAMPGFLKLQDRRSIQGVYAKALASGFVKFTTEGRALAGQDSVQGFIELADLHRDLTEQAHQFLEEEVSFIYEDQPIQPLLLSFAAYRLNQVSRKYYFATLQSQPTAVINDLKHVIKQRQEEYDELLQHI